MHIWLNTSRPVVTIPKVWSAQSKPGLPETGSVKTRTVPVCQNRVQAMSSSFSFSLWDSCWLFESVCACPCVLYLSLPHALVSPYLVCPFPFLSVCPLLHIFLSLLFLSPSPVYNFLQLPFSVSFQF